MSCDEIRELVHGFQAGSLEESQKFKVESHLRECRDCSIFLEQSNELWSLLDAWETIEPTGDFVSQFWKQVPREDLRKGGILDYFRNLGFNWAFGVALAAMMIVVSVITLNIFQPDYADVVFTDADRADEKLLIELDNAISRETAVSLDIYGPWEEIDQNNEGG